VKERLTVTTGSTFATSGGRFKDFEISRPLEIKKTVLIAIFDVSQTIIVPAVAVGMLYGALTIFGGAFDPASPTLIIMALLSWLLFRATPERRSAAIPTRVAVAADMALRWCLLLSLLRGIGKLDLESSPDVYSTAVCLTWSAATPLMLVLARLSMRRLRHRFLSRATHRRSAVIAGYSAGGLKLARRLRRDSSMRLEVAGFFDDRIESLQGVESDVNILGSLSDLGTFVRRHRTDLIFVALPNRDVQGVSELLDDLRDTTASIYYVPDSLDLDHVESRSEQVQGIPVVAMSGSPLHGFSGIGRRLNDLGLALFILSALQPLLLQDARASNRRR
jgi:putative colanic acid biosynthesis UDP-glucose lipid carrier transferase